MNRRDALITIPLLPLAARADSAPVVRRYDPLNLEPAFAEQTGFLTPTERFFTRSHFKTPSIDPKTFALSIEGEVSKPLKLSLAELVALPQITKAVTMECAGNGRVFLTPATAGLQWAHGAVGTAEWGGVMLRTVLEQAGIKPDVAEVILVGADSGSVNAEPSTPGPIAFDRSIPFRKIDDVILATHMNGEPLTPAHGFPLRAVVAGYYGMASIKWLSRIILTRTPYDGYWQTMDYSEWTRRDGGLPTLVPLGAMNVKAQIAAPSGVVKDVKEIRGYAWAGEDRVAKVEVSTDGGTTWNVATLVGEEKPHCWREWTLPWTPAKGSYKLLARCYDSKGRTQPEKRDADHRTYAITHLIPVEVTVR